MQNVSFDSTNDLICTTNNLICTTNNLILIAFFRDLRYNILDLFMD